MAENTISEIWRPVPGFPGIMASSCGRIRGTSGLILTAAYGTTGYPCVNFFVRGKNYRRMVHTLVCEAFHGSRPQGMVCAHGDGDRENARPENLRWCTRIENERDKVAHGTKTVGEGRPNSKLTEKQVIEIRAAGGFQSDIAAKYGIRQQHVSLIKSGKLWGYLHTPVTRPDDPKYSRRRGRQIHSAKLTPEIVREIRAAEGTLKAIAERFGSTICNVHLIRSRKSWKHVD